MVSGNAIDEVKLPMAVLQLSSNFLRVLAGCAAPRIASITAGSKEAIVGVDGNR